MKHKKHIFRVSAKSSLSLALLLGAALGTTANAQVQADCTQVKQTNQVAVQTQWPRVEQKVQLNAELWVSFAQAETWQKQGDAVFVDVRPKAKHETQLATDVLTMSLHEIEQQKALFSDKRLVLLGTGFDQLTLQKAVVQLQKAGFNAYALTGGVRSLLGTPYGKHLSINPFEITPEEFWLGSAATHWQVVTFGVHQQQFSHLPQEPLALPAHEKNVKEKLAEQTIKQNDFIEYVFIAPDDTSTQALQRSFKNMGLNKDAVWLQGGMHNYENYMKEQQMIRNYAQQPLIRPCGSI